MDPHLTVIIQWIISPLLLFLVGLLGYFGRDAYSRIKEEVDCIRKDMHLLRQDLSEKYVKREDWRDEWRQFREDWTEYKSDTMQWRSRIEQKMDGKVDRTNNH